MPVLIDSIAEDLHELLEDCCLAPIALLRKICAVMEVAVDIAVMFVVGVLGAEDGWADGAGEVLDVVFAVESCYIRATQSTAAVVAEEVEAFEVIGFAERVLVGWVIRYREEFGGDDLVAVLCRLYISSCATICI